MIKKMTELEIRGEVIMLGHENSGKFGKPLTDLKEIVEIFEVTEEAAELYLKERFNSDNKLRAARV